MMANIIGIICLVTLFPKPSNEFSAEWYGHGTWTYDETSELGPQYWNKSWPDCSGNMQSPINIDTSNVWYSSTLTILDMIGYESIPPGAHWELKNVGHAIHLTLTGAYRIHGGGLPGEYQADHMEFHWGKTETSGTEHTIDGKANAMELQIVHYNMKYKSHDVALAYEDGLAVLSFLLKVGASGNPVFGQILNNLAKISKVGTSVALRPIPLFSLLPVNVNDYYRYTGSLSIPPCLDIVHWTIFSDMAEISAEQLKIFQKFSLSSKMGEYPREPRRMERPDSGPRVTADNCRPVQPLNGRTVYSSDPNDANILNSPLTSSLSVTLACSLGFVIILVLVNMPFKREGAYEEAIPVDLQHED